MTIKPTIMPKKNMSGFMNKDNSDAAPTDGGMSKRKATRIAHSKYPDQDSRPYEKRSRDDLYKIAKALGIDGRSKMDKEQLIRAIRNH